MFSLSLSAKYKTEEIESFHTIDEAFYIIFHVYEQSFFICLQQKTTYSNSTKKRVGGIMEQPPTFKMADEIIIERKNNFFVKFCLRIFLVINSSEHYLKAKRSLTSPHPIP
jgi:hypothetical protein